MVAFGLVLLTLAVLLLRYDAFPLSLWDESRNANSAIEMAAHGDWLITTFNGLPDHWNTKPPPLIWFMAALLKCGFPPLLAFRLPSALAAAATVVILFTFCRLALHDRLAGLLASLLVVSSSLFMGPHVARTGDYDALLSLFLLVQIVAVARYVEAQEGSRSKWLAVAGGALALAVLTKSIAGLFVGPGLLAYVVVRRRLLSLLSDPHLWLVAAAVLSVCGAYYATREYLDPGYLHAVWLNELGGRYDAALAQLEGGRLYYLVVLFLRFEPGIVLLPTVAVSFLHADTERRNAVLISLSAAASLLLVITSASTKAWWYAAPLVPMLSLAIGIGLSDVVARVEMQRIRVRPGLFKAVLTIGFAAAVLMSFYRENVGIVTWAEHPDNAQLWYGAFLAEMRDGGRLPANMLIVDGGVANDTDFTNYNPIADFYRKDAVRYGEHIDIAPLTRSIAADTWVITCDPAVRQQLPAFYQYEVIRSSAQCEFGLVGGPRTSRIR